MKLSCHVQYEVDWNSQLGVRSFSFLATVNLGERRGCVFAVLYLWFSRYRGLLSVI